ncbi:MAG TPA: hypothetical protein VFA18_20450, partial [Gemmataceae bacterium]|nr:hypothetical protein [Gemmataceae bacterium]
MHSRMAWLLGALIVGSAGWAVLSMGQGAGPLPAAPSPSSAQLATQEPVACSDATSDLERQVRSSLHQAAAWLARSPQANGLISKPWATLEDGQRRQQADILIALACAARFFNDPHQSAVAQQGIELLLRQVTPPLRNDCLPATAGLLVRAIHKLATPAKRLLAQSEELCRYIATQQRSDGAFADSDEDEAGELLIALMAGRQRPAAWKIAVIERACAYYVAHWRAHPNLASLPSQVQAYALAYRWTGQ